jgi:hypothetical protein
MEWDLSCMIMIVATSSTAQVVFNRSHELAQRLPHLSSASVSAATTSFEPPRCISPDQRTHPVSLTLLHIPQHFAMARYHTGFTERAAAKQSPNRQRYSLYIPVTSKIRRESFGSKSDEKARKERSEISRGSIDPISGKRRGTIRSREHDEEAEQIQRAIEESAREAGRRGGKRSRDESSEE